MSDSKPIAPPAEDATPDTKAATSDRELTDADLSQVSGGMVPDTHVRKTKTADKAADAVDAYIRG
jgi:hypothetical protein